LGRGFTLQGNERKPLEEGITGLGKLGTRKEDGAAFGEADLNEVGRELFKYSECDLIRKLQSNLFTLRNDLDHAGMRPRPKAAEELQDLAQGRIWRQFEELAKRWALV